jgi:hypothetical protein
MGSGLHSPLYNEKYLTALPLGRQDSVMRAASNEPDERRKDDVGSHAARNLRFIRDALENAGSFTAVSGRGQVAIGATAVVAALLASRQVSRPAWLATWLVEATLACAIGGVAMAAKARRKGLPLLSGAGRRFWPAFAAPMAAGAVLTSAFVARGLFELLPGLWLLLFGTAVVAGGSVSVPLVRWMGWCFLGLGVVAFLAPPELGDGLLAAGFGGLLAGFGVAIARRHGG